MNTYKRRMIIFAVAIIVVVAMGILVPVSMLGGIYGIISAMNQDKERQG